MPSDPIGLYGSSNAEATTIDTVIDTDSEFTDKYTVPVFYEHDQNKKVNVHNQTKLYF